MEFDDEKEILEGKSQLPDTQNVDSLYGSDTSYTGDTENDDVNSGVWGRLFPVGRFNFPLKELTKSVYKIGRSYDCDLQITNKYNIESALFLTISKEQFKIELETASTGSNLFSLYDLSSNGTYVNNIKVGKNNKVYLKNNDEIALALPQNKVYVFIDALAFNCWLPVSERRNYGIISQLGRGAFGEVKLAVKNMKTYAIKKIRKNICQTEIFKNKTANEIKILSRLNHLCIIKMEDVFESDDAVFIVLEYMPGGDLRQRLNQTKYFSEKEAKFLFYQLVLAVQYLHNENVIHRDLKPENVLLLSLENNETLLKLSDFGLSKILESTSALKTFCGTLAFTAPEILASKGCIPYTPQVDVWSLGCILYLCLTGRLPFDNNGPIPIQERIYRGYYQAIVSSGERTISHAAVDLTEKMLVVNAMQRITVDSILKHPWLQDKPMKTKVEDMLCNVGKEDLENVSPEFENEKKKRKII